MNKRLTSIIFDLEQMNKRTPIRDIIINVYKEVKHECALDRINVHHLSGAKNVLLALTSDLASKGYLDDTDKELIEYWLK